MKHILYIVIVCITIIYSCRKDIAPSSFNTGDKDNSYYSDINSYIPLNYDNAGNGFGTLLIDMDKDGKNDIVIALSVSNPSKVTNILLSASTKSSIFSISTRPIIIYDSIEIDTVYSKSLTLPVPANDTIEKITNLLTETPTSKIHYQRNLSEPKAKNYRIDTILNWSLESELYFSLMDNSSSSHQIRPTFNYNFFFDYLYGNGWSKPQQNYLCIKKTSKGVNKYGWILLDNNWKVISCALQK